MFSLVVSLVVLQVFQRAGKLSGVTAAAICTGADYEVPDFLSHAIINVAAASSGGTCSSTPNVDCNKAIDGRAESGNILYEWYATGAEGNFINLTFAKTFSVNTLRIMQRGATKQQSKKINLQFSGGESTKVTLKKNSGTLDTDPAMWETIDFPEVRASWVKIVIESVYSKANNGFKEIEIYNNRALKGKLCDSLSLASNTKSLLQPLYGRTVSLVLKTSGLLVALHAGDESSSKKYTFSIGIGGQCTLKRFDGSSDTQKASVACAVNAAHYTTAWIDFRSAYLVQGAGTSKLLEWLDVDPLDLAFISFETKGATAEIQLCHRENKCFRDADHFWPLDKVSGGVVHDLNGGRNGITNLTNADFSGVFPAFHMFAMAPLVATNAGKSKGIILGQFPGECLGDIDLCVNGFALGFWLQIPTGTTKDTALFTAKVGRGFLVFFSPDSPSIHTTIRLRTKTHFLSVPIVIGKTYHFAVIWTAKKSLKVLLNGIEFSGSTVSDKNYTSEEIVTASIAQVDFKKGAFYISGVAFWNKEISGEQINHMLACAHVGNVDESCSPAVKVACGSGLSQAQCTSIGCCHDGSTCFKRDGVGNQATIPTTCSSLSASSIGSRETPALNGKISSQDSTVIYKGWSPSASNKKPRFQIDTSQIRTITAVVVQGADSSYVKTFVVSHSKSCASFTYVMEGASKKIFIGNTDATSLKTVPLPAAVDARCIRIEPQTFIGKIALKAKLLGTRKAKTFHGCYKSVSGYAHANYYDSSQITPEKCITACGIASKTYAALKYGKYCFCGSAVDAANSVSYARCNIPCGGDVAINCGSNDAFSVYTVSGSFSTVFNCSFPSNVRSLTNFSASCTPNSLVKCDFGESLPVEAENTPIVHSYYSVPEEFHVNCMGYLDVPGEREGKLFQDSIKVNDDFNVELSCPAFAITNAETHCHVNVKRGTGLQLSYQLAGQPVVNLDLCDATGIGVGEIFEAPIGGSGSVTNATSVTVLFPDTRSLGDAKFIGIEANVERAGCMSIQKLRPICGSLYRYIDGRTEAQTSSCSFTTNCTTDQTFNTAHGLCLTNGSILPESQAPSGKYEVAGVNHVCLLSSGLHRIYFAPVNVSDILAGDIFALHFSASGSVKLSSRSLKSSGSAVLYTGVNRGLGSTLNPEGSAMTNTEYSIVFLTRIVCQYRLELTYTAIGVYSEKVKIKSTEREQELTAAITVQDKISNVTWSYRDAAAVNEPYTVTISPHNGTTLFYRMQFNNATSMNVSKAAALENLEFTHTYTSRGNAKLNLAVSNGVSMVYLICDIKVITKIDGLNFTRAIAPTAYPRVTQICFRVTKGDDVTISVGYGNGHTASNGTFDIVDMFVGCFNHSYSVGVYPLTVNATNPASEQNISQLIIVEKHIVRFKSVVNHAARDIEVNENICVVCSVDQGTTPTYTVVWGDGVTVAGLGTRYCRSFSVYAFYLIKVTAENNVSRSIIRIRIQVHKPVFPLLNFNVTCPPTNFSTPSPFVLTIAGGNDFTCNWQFGDGGTNKTNQSLVGIPVDHLYAAHGYYTVQVVCTNRLYNTTIQTLAIVEIPMSNLHIGQIPNCPRGQSTTAYVAVDTGSGVDFIFTKTNYRSGVSEELAPVFNAGRTNGSVTFQCAPIGEYYLKAIAVNNVTAQQTYSMYFKIDFAILGAIATQVSAMYIPVFATSQIKITMIKGSNVTCFWDFKDGVAPSFFVQGNYSSDGQIVSHAYQTFGNFSVDTVCNNSVSEARFITMVTSQHPINSVSMSCSDPQPFPPGQIQCTLDKPAGIPTPTSCNCKMDYGDGKQTTHVFAPPLVITHAYATVGGYDIIATCSNDVSNDTFAAYVEVQTLIDNYFTRLTTTGGIYGSGSIGKGPNFSYFPTHSNITLDVGWGNGTNVSVTVKWGDGTSAWFMNTTTINHLYISQGSYAVDIEMANAVSEKKKSYILHLQDEVQSFGFRNNGPVSQGKSFTFTLSALNAGTDSCFSLDVGNGSSYLYKPTAGFVCHPECASGNVIRTYQRFNVPFNLTHRHYYFGNYPIRAIGCNYVSIETVDDLANLSPKPCKYPKVNFTAIEANSSLEHATPCKKAKRNIITPRIVIECEATKLSSQKWSLSKCSKEYNNCTKFSRNCTRAMSMSNPSLVLPERCLEYGYYLVTSTVEMIGGGTRGIFTRAEGYILVDKTPLVAQIAGGTSKAVGYGKVVVVNGKVSYDPDTKDNTDMTYYWFCAEDSEGFSVVSNSSELPAIPNSLHNDLQAALNQSKTSPVPSNLYKGCHGYGPGRLDATGGSIDVVTRGMKVNYTYVITLLVVKDTRWAITSLSIQIMNGDPPDCEITCVAGCGPKANPSDKHALKVVCECAECGAIAYQWHLSVKNKTTSEMTRITNLRDMTIMSLTNINIVIKPNMLLGGHEYLFKIDAYDTLHKIKGHSARKVITNASPRGGLCSVSPSVGDNESPFNVSCWDWQDDEDYLTYSVNLYDTVLKVTTPLVQMRSKPFDLKSMSSVLTQLSVGEKKRDFKQLVRIRICDPLLGCIDVDLEVQVNLKEKDDGEFQSFLDVLLNPDGVINSLLGEGKTDDLCTFILNSVNTLKALQQSIPANKITDTTRKLIQRSVVISMDAICLIVSSDPQKASCKATVIGLILEVDTTLSAKTKQQSTECLMEAASDLSHFPPSNLNSAATGLVSTLGKSFGAITPTIEPVANSDIGGGSSEQKPKTAEEIEKETQEQKRLSMDLGGVLNDLSNAFLGTMVAGEDVEIDTPLLEMKVAKKTANEMKEISSSSGTEIKGLNNVMELNSTKAVNSKLLAFKDNPYSWADGSADITGALIDFSLGNEDGSDKVVEDTAEPIEFNIVQKGQKLNMSIHSLSPSDCNYQVLKIPKNHSAIFIEVLVTDANVTLTLYLRRGARPNKYQHDFNYTFTQDGNTSETAHKWFVSNDDLNATAAGTWKVAVCGEQDYVLNYNMSMYTAACMFLNETLGKFSTAGLKVGNKTTQSVTQCFATHMTSFAGDFFVPPNSIDWSKISLDELLKNPIVFIVVMCIFGLYFLTLVWARRADKKDLDKIGLTPLPDNDPRDNYLYEIVVFTGHQSGSATTSDVFMVLTGGLDETSPRQLMDPEPSRKKFLRGNADYFLLAVPGCLGKLKQLRIWHNNKGDDPSWFLQRVMVRDLQADKKTWFVNLRWLAVEEDDGMVERFLHPATKEELTNFGLLFSTEARKNLFDNHLWFSVVARPAKSTFTRVQRLSCCLSIILTTMVANAMFYQVGDESSTGTSIHVGPFSFSVKQISIAITSSLVVLPVNVLIVTIFRKIRPPDPHRKNAEQDPNNQGEKYQLDDEAPDNPLSDREEEEDENEDANEEEDDQNKKKKKEKKKKKSMTLNPKFAYLAYVLVFFASTVSATFTVFYGLTFGKEKSEGWLSSIMISFWQDVLISQPLKVFAAAMFFALVIKDPNKGEDENEQQQNNELTPDEELIHKNVQNSDDEKTLRKLGFVEKPPDPEKLEAFRQLRLKQKQMKSILYEMIQYLFFLVIVLIIAYGNRDPMAYGVTKTLQDLFIDSEYTGLNAFSGSNAPASYWTWIDKTFLATLMPQYWYGPYLRFNQSLIDNQEIKKKRKVIKLKNIKAKGKWRTANGNYIGEPSVLFQYKTGFTADHETAYLVGSPRLRQLRIKKNQCTMLPFAHNMFDECNADYDWDLEDQKSYHPTWKPFVGNDTKDPELKSPWYYRSAWELKGTPYWGLFASYWAGGYVADFGSDRTNAEAMAQLLNKQKWIDKYTRAVFAEFTIYNAYTNFFSAITLLTEVRATGGFHHMPKIQTLRLYRYIGPEMVFVMACEISYIAFLVYFLYKQVKKYREEGKRAYLRDPWNYLEIALLSFSIASVGFYFARLGMTSYTIKNMKESPDSFVSFQYVAFLDEWVSACCSLAVFFSFLKFLRLLRFNRRMALLTLTLKKASTPLFFFFVYFGFIFFAYAQFGYSVFSSADDNYSSFHQTIVTLFGMTLGDFDFQALLQANRLFGPLFFFSYVLLILFILMNVFLSIIVDTFNEVNRDVLQQGNDHEIMSFMMHTMKANIGKKVGPAIKPTYVDQKTKLEKDIDDIEDISENIQYAFRNICMEDIRQAKWFDPRTSSKKKKLVVKMLLESDENYSENDLCDAIPVLDEYMANHSVKTIVHAMFLYREMRRQEELVDNISRMSDSTSEEEDTEGSELGSDEDTDDEYEQHVAKAQFLAPNVINHGTHKSTKSRKHSRSRRVSKMSVLDAPL